MRNSIDLYLVFGLIITLSSLLLLFLAGFINIGIVSIALIIIFNSILGLSSFYLGTRFSRKRFVGPYSRFSSNFVEHIVAQRPFILRKDDAEFQEIANTFNTFLIQLEKVLHDIMQVIKENSQNNLIKIHKFHLLRNFVLIRNQTFQSYSIRLLGNSKEIIEYERGLYDSFCSYNGWLCKNYLKSGKDRIRSFIPYSSQLIYVLYLGEKAIANVAINTDISQTTQLEYMGFSIPGKWGTKKTVEILNFFTCQSINPYFGIGTLFNYFSKEMQERGKTNILASCSEKLLKIYKRTMNFEEIEETKLDGEKEYFIALEL